MALIMPSQAKCLSPMNVDLQESAKRSTGQAKKKDKKRLEPQNSLNVACLKRLLPIGLSLFGGREQELLQLAKKMLIQVCEWHILRLIMQII